MKEIIFSLLEHALDDFYAKEQINLQLDVHEIAHGHRLAIYFENRLREYDNARQEKLFENYFVDIEFNRMEGGAVKTVFYDGMQHETRCDILLHSKGEVPAKENLLVVELKKEHSTNKEQDDIKEIKRMVSPAEDGAPDRSICDTLLGVYLKIGQNCYFGSRYWFENNAIVGELFHKRML